MSIDAAKAIVREKMDEERLKAFLDTYEPGENPVTRVLVWDHRVLVVGHSANKAACVAISAAIQTAAAIGRSLRCIAKVELYKTTNEEPVYDVIFQEGQRARRVIAGVMASFAGIAQQSERGQVGSAMLLSDHRKHIPSAAPSFGS